MTVDMIRAGQGFPDRVFLADTGTELSRDRPLSVPKVTALVLEVRGHSDAGPILRPLLKGPG